MTKFLYQPVSPFRVNQKFGDDQVCYRVINGKKEYRGKFTHENCQDKYGLKWKSIYRKMKGHNGLDLEARYCQPCYAMQEGLVMEISTEEDEGLGVVLRHTINGQLWKTRYWHFMAVKKGLQVGDWVKTGELIGYCGDTGRATGPHLHIDLKKMNQNWQIEDYDNGYFGAVDPEPYMVDIFAPQIAHFTKLYHYFKNLLTKGKFIV